MPERDLLCLYRVINMNNENLVISNDRGGHIHPRILIRINKRETSNTSVNFRESRLSPRGLLSYVNHGPS